MKLNPVADISVKSAVRHKLSSAGRRPHRRYVGVAGGSAAGGLDVAGKKVTLF